ncbi:hypothetical protein [Marinobacter sp. ELB17]|uniref:hypothetical protein n=1 Tax=Marinobacter sp. ELB17 TaxID=270374 RepID=UPI0000F39C65|nr:hypothetical protein [Marinobacter sp. ELB17]EAZ97228.1 hypothetical protein MELB17_10063 [Marinobacter sp. ELB17]
MPYSRDLIIKKRAENSFIYPSCCPGLRPTITGYGNLIQNNENVQLSDFIGRVAAQAHTDPKAVNAANHLQRWFVLMELTMDSFIRHGQFPQTFNWKGLNYDFDACLEILGREGVKRAIKAGSLEKIRHQNETAEVSRAA